MDHPGNVRFLGWGRTMSTARRNPEPGDYVVNYNPPDGFVIEMATPEHKWEQVAFDKSRLNALKVARHLAYSAGTKAWTYELDNQFLEI